MSSILPAQAQSVSIDGVVRTASLYTAIRHECRGQFQIDDSLAGRMAEAALEVAKNVVGERAAMNLITREIVRRQKEVAATGRAQWCAYQRGHQKQVGTKVFTN